jgi:hypothetical protein
MLYKLYCQINSEEALTSPVENHWDFKFVWLIIVWNVHKL